MIKLAGWFHELGALNPGSPPQPSIADHVAEPLPDADRVVGYLESGHLLIDMMDVQNDWFEPDQQIVNGPAVQTDGEWFWRRDLAHYVARHHVAVPTELLDKIRQSDYTVPHLDKPTLIALTDEIEPLIF